MRGQKLTRMIFIGLIILLVITKIPYIININSQYIIPLKIQQNGYSMFQIPAKLTDFTLKELNQFDTGFGYMKDVKIANDLVFTVAHRGGMLIFNISDYTQPFLIGSYDEPKEITEEKLWDLYGGLTSGLDLRDDLVYLSDGLNGMLILNISDPTKPRKISHYKESAISGVIIEGNFAYERLSALGIRVINITDPTNPFLVSEINDELFEPGDKRDFIVKGNYLFVLSHDLIVFDISDPTHPVEITRKEKFYGKSLNIVENKLFVFSHSPDPSEPYPINLTVFDISDPRNIHQLSDRIIIEGISDYISNSLVYNNTIFLSSNSRIYTVTFDDTYNLTLLSSIPCDGTMDEFDLKTYPSSIGSDSLIIFCSNRNRGLQVFDFTNLSNPSLQAEYDLGGQAKAVFADEQYAYLCTHHEFPSLPSTFLIIKYNNTPIPELVASFPFNNDVIVDIWVSNNYAYIAGYYTGLTILNLTNPLEPSVVGTYSEGINDARAIFYDQIRELVFLANYGSGFSILDVSNKTQPILLCKNNHWGMSVVDVFVEGDLLFLADRNMYGGFGIVNISNPSTPRFLDAVYLGESSFSVYAKGTFLYVSTDLTPLYIFDISHPEKPVRVGMLYTGKWFDGLGLVVQGAFAYLAREANGLMVIDVSNPTRPNLLVEYRDYYAGISFDVTVHGDYIFLADGWDGLEILELIPPKIAYRNYLLITILPPIGGVCLIATIVILQYSKKKVVSKSLNNELKKSQQD